MSFEGSVRAAAPNGEPQVEVIPLGGLGEIGLNSMVLSCEGEMIVIDAGLMFPRPDQPGVDLVVPDFSFLKANEDRIAGLVLTHGHEDHIGALPFLMKELPGLPVFGTPLTLAFTRDRILEQRAPQPAYCEIRARDKVRLGCFELEFIKVNHSILDGVGVAVRTPAGTVVHTGDFKMDLSAPPEDRTDLYKFASYGEEGVLALLSDSTNSDVPGHSVSEKEVGRTLARIFREAPGRIILACFASSLGRIREIVKAAVLSERRIVFDGRSMTGNVRLAQELGYLVIPPGIEIDFYEAQDCEDSELVIVATGSQGEPLSALSRMAAGEHRQVEVRGGDTIIFSARAIPGNETAISALVNLFRHLGAKVVDPQAETIHASGHGHIDELKLMLALTRPHYLIPVHGELRHLHRHREIAEDLGMPRSRILLLADGQRVALSRDRSYRMMKSVPVGKRLVEGMRLGSPADPVLKERRRLSEHGVVSVSAALDSRTLEPLAPPAVSVQGVRYSDEEDLTLSVQETAWDCCARFAKGQGAAAIRSGKAADTEELLKRLRGDVRSVFRRHINRKPVVIVQVILTDPESPNPQRAVESPPPYDDVDGEGDGEG
ncbi:MAG: ribonuclease J [Deltaproteobacteria bacterium]|jgi:ribonuclease J|nr:ribonuclease J [Deltaproteobacteria bacterium]